MTISPTWGFQLLLDCLFDERSENGTKKKRPKKGEKSWYISKPDFSTSGRKVSFPEFARRALHSDLSGAPASGGGAGEAAGNDGAI